MPVMKVTSIDYMIPPTPETADYKRVGMETPITVPRVSSSSFASSASGGQKIEVGAGMRLLQSDFVANLLKGY